MMSENNDLTIRIAVLEAEMAELKEQNRRERAEMSRMMRQLLQAIGLQEALDTSSEHLEQVIGIVQEVRTLQRQQEIDRQAVTTLFEERANELSTAALLDLYEQRIRGTGQELKAWLRSIKAEHRYRAVVALRSRRQKDE
jgi:hypothetical protein